VRYQWILGPALALLAVPGLAQDAADNAAAAEGAAASVPLPDPATIAMPNLAVSPTEADAQDFDKYFYFHRADTTFAQAWADISECDALSSGIAYRAGGAEPYPGYYGTNYGIGGVIGAAIGSALADAIHGSAERREIRRENMRNCMGFKGYQRFGLPKDVWEQFHFEEGNGRKPEDERRMALLQQAVAASAVRPQGQELGI
jgi:hypothetical protein